MTSRLRRSPGLHNTRQAVVPLLACRVSTWLLSQTTPTHAPRPRPCQATQRRRRRSGSAPCCPLSTNRADTGTSHGPGQRWLWNTALGAQPWSPQRSRRARALPGIGKPPRSSARGGKCLGEGSSVAAHCSVHTTGPAVTWGAHPTWHLRCCSAGTRCRVGTRR